MKEKDLKKLLSLYVDPTEISKGHDESISLYDVVSNYLKNFEHVKISKHRDDAHVKRTMYFTFFKVPPKQRGYLTKYRNRQMLAICYSRSGFNHKVYYFPINDSALTSKLFQEFKKSPYYDNKYISFNPSSKIIIKLTQAEKEEEEKKREEYRKKREKKRQRLREAKKKYKVGICPNCNNPIQKSGRYPIHLCSNCVELITAIDGRPVAFHNVNIAGGCIGSYRDFKKEKYSSDICYIEEKKYYAQAARFGGIVIQPHELKRS